MDEMIKRGTLSTLCTYNTCANQLVLDTVAQLSETDFTRESSPSHGSVRGLLIHMLRVEASFLARCQERCIEADDLPALADIRRHWHTLSQEMHDFIASLDESRLHRVLLVPMRDRSFRFPTWQMLLQALLHSHHHRGELSIVLSALGYPLPTLDIIVHLAEQSGQPWPWE